MIPPSKPKAPKAPLSLSASWATVHAADAWLGLDSLNGRYAGRATDDTSFGGLCPPGQEVIITERTWIPFRGERLFVHRAGASDFLIRNVFVRPHRGGTPANMTPVIAEPFAVDFDELAAISFAVDQEGRKPVKIIVNRSAAKFLGAPFQLPPLMPGMDLQFHIENIGREPRRFLGAFYGKGLW